jgi:hypothetical protein
MEFEQLTPDFEDAKTRSTELEKARIQLGAGVIFELIARARSSAGQRAR